MIRHLQRGCTIAAVLIFTAPVLFAEVCFGNHTFSARFYSDQYYENADSCLNPDNVFDVDEGFAGKERFTTGYHWAGKNLSVTMNDFMSLTPAEDPGFTNCFGELYGSVCLGNVFIDIGKKRINQSLSYFKSPINFVLSGYDQYDLQFSEGCIMANIEAFTDFGFIGFSFMPECGFNSDIERYVSSSQDRQLLLRYDLPTTNCTTGIAVYWNDNWRLGCHFSRTLGDYAEIHTEYVFNEKKNVSGFRLNDGIASNVSVTKKYCSEGLLGLTVNSAWLSGIGEYYYNQAGYSYDEWKDVTDTFHDIRDSDQTAAMYRYNLGTAFQSMASNRSFGCGRHYAMLRLSNPSTEKLQYSVNMIVNLQDGSGMVTPSIRYDGWEHIAAEASFSACFGNPYSEFMLYADSWQSCLTMEIWL
ncbi:MAG: hypothetical protein M0P01_02910 [Treponema sp.]|nr:hypothetical protein [Treponema sp.]